MKYFDVFALPADFDLDEKDLEARYRRLAAESHPDRVAGKNAFEQKQAMMMAATINEAYRVLSSPVSRAAYMLKEEGVDADSPEKTHFPTEFLMQQMQWRERLDDARDASDRAELESLLQEVAQAQADNHASLRRGFLEKSSEEKLLEWVNEGRFLEKLLTQIENTLAMMS